MGQAVNSSNLDELIKNKFIPLRKKIVDSLIEKYPEMHAMINPFMNKKGNKFGLQTTENGKVVGEYTFILDGIHTNDFESGKLDSVIQHPFLGILKPYVTIGRSALENIVAEGENIKNVPLETITKHLPDITIRYLH
jgi:hypothetical protein